MKRKCLILLILVAGFLAGCTLHVASPEVYTGTVEAEETDVSTEIGGKLTKVFVEEGQKIKIGDRIAKVDTTDLEIKLAKAKAALKIKQANLQEILDGARGEEIKNARANLDKIEVLLEGSRKNYDYRLENYNKIKKLYEDSAASKQQLEDAETLLDAANTEIKSLEKQHDALKAQLDMLLNGATDEKIKMAKANVEMAEAEVKYLENQISKGNLISFVDGVIQNVNYNEGEIVSPGGNIATVVNLKDLWVKIYIPEKKLHKIALNKKMKLYTDFLKDKSISGKVVYISSEAEFTPKNMESKENKEEMVFEVKIKILDKSPELKPGMLVDVKLEGEI
ncbi:MAG: rane fusion protein YbhG [Candidatus Petromonas sp.]|jgi:HlyD family secretion protein|nr:rane fusion protein YbhG [Candidatus Petromonas sp.]